LDYKDDFDWWGSVFELLFMEEIALKIRLLKKS
jgi:hypothetical protein